MNIVKQLKLDYQGMDYWISVVRSEKGGYIAYVSDNEPKGILGHVILSEKRIPLVCQTPEQALMNANAIKRSLIDSKPTKD